MCSTVLQKGEFFLFYFFLFPSYIFKKTFFNIFFEKTLDIFFRLWYNSFRS